jgi:hypothetical protein
MADAEEEARSQALVTNLYAEMVVAFWGWRE